MNDVDHVVLPCGVAASMYSPVLMPSGGGTAVWVWGCERNSFVCLFKRFCWKEHTERTRCGKCSESVNNAVKENNALSQPLTQPCQ